MCEWAGGVWRSIDELEYVLEAVKTTAKGLGGRSKFRAAMKDVQIIRLNIDGWLAKEYRTSTYPTGDIVYTNYGFSSKNYTIYSTIHEFGHVWDLRSWSRLSSEMARVVGTYYCDPYAGWPCFHDVFKGKEPPPGDPDLYKNYAGTNAAEDWAESFATYIYPSYYGGSSIFIGLGPIRRRYVQDQIQSIH